MKKVKSSIGLVHIILFLGITSVQAQVPTGDEVFIKVEINGMACPFCAGGMGKAFEAVDGVTAVDIDFKEGMAYLTVLSALKPDPEVLKKIVQQAGFDVGEITYADAPFVLSPKKKKTKKLNN